VTRVLEKAGFEHEGHLRQNVFFRRDSDGRPRWQDTLEYGLVNPAIAAGVDPG
jgi:RimJ/RimL family protein N-acetyltransferase